MEKMKKADVIRGIAEKAGMSIKDVETAFDATFAYIGEQMAAGKAVPVPGFGTFTLAHREARTGRNPRTNSDVVIPAKTVPVAKFSSTLKTAVVDTVVE